MLPLSIFKKKKLTGGIPIPVRYLESIIRMSEAFALMHLRDYVRQDDVDRAITVTVRSFINSQKYSIKRQMEMVRVEPFPLYLPCLKSVIQASAFIRPRAQV